MDEIKSLLREYAIDLENTGKWQSSRNAAYQSLYLERTQQYAAQQRQFVLYKPVGCDRCTGTGYVGALRFTNCRS